MLRIPVALKLKPQGVRDRFRKSGSAASYRRCPIIEHDLVRSVRTGSLRAVCVSTFASASRRFDLSRSSAIAQGANIVVRRELGLQLHTCLLPLNSEHRSMFFILLQKWNRRRVLSRVSSARRPLAEVASGPDALCSVLRESLTILCSCCLGPLLLQYRPFWFQPSDQPADQVPEWIFPGSFSR
jgi:hypothetical protein